MSGPSHAELMAAYDATHSAWVRYRDAETLRQKYEALNGLARAGIAPGQQEPGKPMDAKHYQLLLRRCKMLCLDAQWLDVRIAECERTGMADRAVQVVGGYLQEFEDRVREIEKGRTKKEAARDGRKKKEGKALRRRSEKGERLVRNEEGERYEEICHWAAANRIDRQTVFAHFGALSPDASLDELRGRIQQVIDQRREREKPKMSLFEKAKVVDRETGKVERAPEGSAATEALQDNAEEEQRELQAALETLRLERPPTIGSKTDLDQWLRQRTLIINEYAYLYENYRDNIARLERELAAWERVVQPQCELYLDANPPERGKSVALAYGKVGYRDQAESLAIDTASDDIARQRWLGSLPPEMKARFKVVPIERYAADWGAIKAWWLEQDPKERPPIPDTIHTERKLNKFYVSPSLDTVKQKIRDRKFMALGGKEE